MVSTTVDTIIQWVNLFKLNFAIEDLTVIAGAWKADILMSPSPPLRMVLAVPLHWKESIKGKWLLNLYLKIRKHH